MEMAKDSLKVVFAPFEKRVNAHNFHGPVISELCVFLGFVMHVPSALVFLPSLLSLHTCTA